MRKANGKTREMRRFSMSASRATITSRKQLQHPKPEKAADQGRRGKGIWRPRPLF